MKPVLGVSILLHCQSHVLLAQRGKPPSKGLWSLPGGKVEFGETALEAVLRETEEETGITLSNASFHHITEVIYPEFHFVILVHQAEAANMQTPIAGDDAMDAKWFSLEQMAALDAEKRMTKGTFDKIERFLSQKDA